MVIDRMVSGDGGASGDGCAFFYCTFRVPESTDSPSILRSILVQLMSGRQKNLRNTMFKAFETRKSQGQGPPSHLDELKECIVETSRYYGKTTIIIDALDECSQTARQALITCLNKLPSESDGRIRVFITSRDEHDIRRLLRDCPSICLSDESYNLNNDVETYISDRFEEDPRLEEIEEPLRLEIIMSLTSTQNM
jgi:hypothetical protein